MSAAFERVPSPGRVSQFQDAAAITHDPQVRPAAVGGRPLEASGVFGGQAPPPAAAAGQAGAPSVERPAATTGPNPWQSTRAADGEVAPS